MLRSRVSFLLAVCLLAALVCVNASESETSAGRDYQGDMPYPPTTGAGLLSNPPGHHFVIPTRQGALPNYDCAALLRAWHSRADVQAWFNGHVRRQSGMVGLMIVDQFNIGAAGYRAFWTRSGNDPDFPIINSASLPTGLVPSPAPINGHAVTYVGDIGDTVPGVSSGGRTIMRDVVAQHFTVGRRCFGTPVGDWQAANQPTCAAGADGRVTRTWPAAGSGAAPLTEVGLFPGSCALSKLTYYITGQVPVPAPAPGIMVPLHLPPNRIVCAAELTPAAAGWAAGKALDGARAGWANLRPVAEGYRRGDIVSSCVTCQNLIPLFARASCPLRAAPAVPGGVGADLNAIAHGVTGINCPDTLMDGDTCEITCDAGYVRAGAPYGCTNGVRAPQTCVYSALATAALRARQCVNGVCNFVRNNPGKAMLIAGGAAVAATAYGLRRTDKPVARDSADQLVSFKKWRSERQAPALQPEGAGA